MAETVQSKPKPIKLRRSPKQDRGIESRDRILAAAKKILSHEVLETLSMRRISAASNVGLGTIYDYFPSKSALLHTLLEERFKLRLQIFDRTIDVSDGKEKISDFIDSYLERMRRAKFWSGYDAELTKAAYNDPDLKELLDWYNHETTDRYLRVLRRSGSTWADEDLRMVAKYLLTIWTRFGPEKSNNGKYANPDLMEDLVRETFSAILKKIQFKQSGK